MAETKTVAAIRRRLTSLGNADDARFLRGYFRTGPGEYGEGDKFLGIRVPQIRGLVRSLRGTPLSVIEALLHEPWHEARLLAVLLLADAYQKGDATQREAVYQLYLANTARVNNWDLVDSSAMHIVGPHLSGAKRKTVLRRLAKSKILWERRIAVLATFAYIRQDEFDDSIAIAELLLHDEHDLIHKAVGWMLREIGQRDASRLEAFLDAHAHEMPRTMLRYAIEKLPPKRRRHYMDAYKRT